MGGVGLVLLFIIQCVLLILKLGSAPVVAHVSWLLIFCPLWFVLACLLVAFLGWLLFCLIWMGG